MGISVSAATAIVVAGLFVAFGTLFPVAANGVDRVAAADRAVSEDDLDRQNTEIALANATAADGTLNVTVANEGATGLTVSDVSLIADNGHVAIDPGDTTVAGDADTDVWLPGETLTIEVTVAETPDRVLVVTEHGLRVAGPVEGAA